MVENRDNRLPDWLFEVSWEVCNKVGGIHTVVATKAQTVSALLGNHYILVGPDLNREGHNPEFEQDDTLLRAWRQMLYNDGIRVRVGRWRVKGSPVVVLVDFTSMFARKDEVLKFLWETYRVDSISGQWDYIEPVLFGYAAGKIIESYVNNFCNSTDTIAAHFHEWMTASGGLYLRKASPYIATVFTTHATVMGRSLAGNGYPLYGSLEQLNADDYARQFGVVAKHSIEKISAAQLDCFATVSDITARECRYLLGKEVDIVTPNGFEDDFVWKGAEAVSKRKRARARMIEVAEQCWGIKYGEEPLIVGTSGRYEYKNKGIDLFIEALKRVADANPEREILAYLTIPAGNEGPRSELAGDYTTHRLSEPQYDPIVKALRGSNILAEGSKVKVVFVPSYLQGDDGVFNMSYYELLVGMDITVFASYYEPWGYTPLESVAFSVPTITTSLAGFGLWVDENEGAHTGVDVVVRNDTNDDEVVAEIAKIILRYSALGTKEMAAARGGAYRVAQTALWAKLFDYYRQAYSTAIAKATERTGMLTYDGGGTQTEQVNFLRQQVISERPNWTRLMVEARLPESLRPLEILSKNLWWSWTLGAQELFEGIDEELWTSVARNPIRFLDILPTERIRELAEDGGFLEKLDAVYVSFREYMSHKGEAQSPRIGYFSMEYGVHSSLKIYSGGLGILAGDYLKEASDKNVPITAVGLLYRYGYFTQRLSSQGAQEASYEAQNFDKLPISPVRDAEGNWLTVEVAFPGRMLTARIWKCDVGRTDLYLLDTDHDLNLPEDRTVTHYLYGGDWENRLRQEILLGIGGMRALRALGIKCDVYHCNEGHAAFIGIERANRLVTDSKLSFSEAMEVVRASSLFTTHTPVPAGHDAFEETLIRQYMSHYPERLGITWEQFIALGRMNPNNTSERFSMSVLASNMSQEINGVSWLHGEVSKDILGTMWSGYFKNELHIGYVTNGVHFPTWTATPLRRLYVKYFADGFSGPEYDIPAWQKVHNIPDGEFWTVRLKLKNRLMKLIGMRYNGQVVSSAITPSNIVKIKESLDPEVLTIGFARRFATYKRANLLFTDLERLSAIVNNAERPVRFVFAGKAHPNDKPGQDLIKRIVEVSRLPQFVGKILFVENYDMDIARRLVQGVDVWLNTPTRPLEASGTSGEKAVMNGVMQFSVLDGWWVEGYREGAGWMLPLEAAYTDDRFQNELDAEMIYRTIEEQIAPLYYHRGDTGLPHDWIAAQKRCVADIAANFTTNRMLTDYEQRYYHPLAARSAQIVAGDYRMARRLAAWKRRVSGVWDEVRVISTRQVDMGRGAVMVDTSQHIEVTVDVATLSKEDIGVELLYAEQIDNGNTVKVVRKEQLAVVSVSGSEVTYAIDTVPTESGSYDLALRVYPRNENLAHRMEFALVKWA